MLTWCDTKSTSTNGVYLSSLPSSDCLCFLSPSFDFDGRIDTTGQLLIAPPSCPPPLSLSVEYFLKNSGGEEQGPDNTDAANKNETNICLLRPDSVAILVHNKSVLRIPIVYNFTNLRITIRINQHKTIIISVGPDLDLHNFGFESPDPEQNS